MYKTNTLTQGLYGSYDLAGVPLYVIDGLWKIGGFIANDNTETAYFGRVVSAASNKPNIFYVGKPESTIVTGILINEQAVNQNEPVKATYLLPNEPATVLKKGAIFLKKFKTGTGFQTTPDVTSKVVFNTTTGEIGFIAANASVPSGYEILSAKVWYVDKVANGVLIWVDSDINIIEIQNILQTLADHEARIQALEE